MQFLVYILDWLQYLCQLVPLGFQVLDYPILFCVLRQSEFQQDLSVLYLLLIGLCKFMCVVNSVASYGLQLVINLTFY